MTISLKRAESLLHVSFINLHNIFYQQFKSIAKGDANGLDGVSVPFQVRPIKVAFSFWVF
jgi:hypothetical protein